MESYDRPVTLTYLASIWFYEAQKWIGAKEPFAKSELVQKDLAHIGSPSSDPPWIPRPFWESPWSDWAVEPRVRANHCWIPTARELLDHGTHQWYQCCHSVHLHNHEHREGPPYIRYEVAGTLHTLCMVCSMHNHVAIITMHWADLTLLIMVQTTTMTNILQLNSYVYERLNTSNF